MCYPRGGSAIKGQKWLLSTLISQGTRLLPIVVTAILLNGGSAQAQPSVTSQPISQTVQVGGNVTFGVGTDGTGPFTYQWLKNNTTVPDGTPDASFSLPYSSEVKSVALQSNGQIIVGDYFSGYSYYFARLQTNGAVDPSFDANANVNGTVYAIAVQPDDKVVIGGSFEHVGNVSHPYIARLNPDGSVDTNFVAAANNYVTCLALQPDGKILLGGSFTQLNSSNRNYFARLNADGSLDQAFAADANGAVSAIAVQPDGHIIIGGSFNSLGGASRTCLARISADGTLDSSFAPFITGAVQAIAMQTNGSFIIGGGFSSVGGASRTYIARFNADGSLDNSFAPYLDNSVTVLTPLPDGRLIVGGAFSTVAGSSRYRIARFLSNGSLDTNFAPSVGSPVNCIVAQTDGRTLVGTGSGMARFNSSSSQILYLNNISLSDAGSYSVLVKNASGTTTSDAAILTTGYPPSLTANPSSQTIVFQSNAVFTVSTDGSGPFSYQWQFNGTNLTDSGLITGSQSNVLTIVAVDTNAVGNYSAIITNAFGTTTSGAATLTVVFAPTITTQPVSQTLNLDQSTTLSAAAGGTQPIYYQWLKNGHPTGATTSTYAINYAQATDMADYALVAANAWGSATSAVATVCVVHPATVSAIIINGFLVGASVTDPGYGYTNSPLVHITSSYSGGMGAVAVANVVNGKVTSLTILNAGYGYFSTPQIEIDSPNFVLPSLTISPATRIDFTNSPYYCQLQVSNSVTGWTAIGSADYPTSSNTFTRFVDGDHTTDSYRLYLPTMGSAARQATATAQVMNGFVVGANVVDNGSGYRYDQPVRVQIVGGGGTGAQAYVQVSPNYLYVSGIVVTNAGYGYTSAPDVQIDPPPGLLPTLTPNLHVQFANLYPNRTYQLQESEDLINWKNIGNSFVSDGNSGGQYLNLPSTNIFFRLQYLP